MDIVKLRTLDDARAFLKAQHGAEIVLDIETTGLTKGSDILSWAVTNKDNTQVAYGDKSIMRALIQPEITYVMHNADFDLKMLAWHGVLVYKYCEWQDTITMHHLVDENASHALGAVVLERYKDNYKEEFWAKHKKAENAPEDELMLYNAKDVYYTHRFYNELKEEIVSQSLQNILNVTHKLQSTLLVTQIEGLRICDQTLMQKGVELKTKINKMLPEMLALVPDEVYNIEHRLWAKEIEKRKTPKGKANVKKPSFTFDSTNQLMELCYSELQLPIQRNEKTKKPSTDYDSLERLRELHPVIHKIQEYREWTKINGTYIDGTLERMVDGRIYPSFNVSGTKTGRISHSDPNMGNLPREGGVRSIFIPDDGYVFISADFSQLEVRLSADVTQDRNLLKIVNEGASQHDITAEALKIPRNLAKSVNFAMQYGAQAGKLQKILGCTKPEAEKAYRDYWNAYSGQKKIMDWCAKQVDLGASLVLPSGRRRRFEVKKRNPWDKAYRQSWNAYIQGRGSDLCSLACVQINDWLNQHNYGRVLFTVHDEIIIMVLKQYAKESEARLVEVMQNVGKEINLSVPLAAESSGACDRWED